MMAKRYNDRPLWEAYWAARAEGDEGRCRLIGGAILECHRGFMIQYANGTKFPSWDASVVRDYQSELIAVALEKMPEYDASRASFPTFVKRYWQETKWKIQIQQQLITTGIETARLRVAADGFVNEFRDENGRDPSLTEVAEWLTVRFSKHRRPVGVAQAARLVEKVVVERPDEVPMDGDGVDGWSLIAAAVSVEDVVIDALDGREVAAAIADALLDTVTTDLERDIVRRRLMPPPRHIVDGQVICPGPESHSSLASAHGCSTSMVKATEEDLVTRMAKALKS